MEEHTVNTPVETPAPAPAREIPFEFRGTGGEYFRIWIVNLLLTLVTLGIYSAWAKVRRLRYFHGSTSLDGASFDYHGKPTAILRGRLIAVGVYGAFYALGRFYPIAGLLLLPLMLFGLPWVIVRSRQFHLRMTSWRGLRFVFHGRYGGAMAAFIGWPAAGLVTLGTLWPLALWKRSDYLLSNAAYGTQRFSFRASKGMFYAIVVMTSLVAAGIAVVSSIAIAPLMVKLSSMQGLPPDRQLAAVLGNGLVLLFLVPGTLWLVVVAFYQRSLLNETWGNLHIGPHRLKSTLKTWPLAGIYITNLLAMIGTLGLFYPWAKVRQIRYQLEHTTLLADGDLDQFTAAAGTATDAVGEEIADVFDVDFTL